MNRVCRRVRLVILLTAVVLGCAGLSRAQVEIVRDGMAVAVIVVEEAALERAGRMTDARRARYEGIDAADADALAAAVLVHWIERMSGARARARLPIVAKAPEGTSAIYVGAAALAAGLSLDDIDSPSREGMRIRTDGTRILLAGQNGTSTIRAAARLLEELGCRYLIDHEIGEVYPERDTIVVPPLDITESPGFALRRTGGAGWNDLTLWKIWNGHGGLDLELGHVWGRYVSRDLFDKHPEYFALRDGQRVRGNWFCTSNPGLRRVFAEGVIREIESGNVHPSISPVAGRGYCECDDCRAQDDPTRIEPTSGLVSLSSRYVDFFAEIGRLVGEKHPDSRLSFIIYHDYTIPPPPPRGREGSRLPDNVVLWQTPHRYCWLHSYFNDNCPSRVGHRRDLDEWAAVADVRGYQAHNYNYGDLILPFSRISAWREKIPDLHARGMIGVSFDTIPNWSVYGPHIYLSLRLAYDPHADADALLDDYFESLLGPDAGPLAREYWEKVDRAYVESDGHNTMFYSMHRAFSPELLGELRGLMDRAIAAAAEPAHAQRIAMFDGGLRNLEQYFEIRAAMHEGDFTTALTLLDEMMARVQGDIDAGLATRHSASYPELFFGRHVRMGGELAAAPNRVVNVLPDEWRFAYEPEQGGIDAGYHRADFDDSDWMRVRTYTDPLYLQGVEERFTYYWYRIEIDVPADVNDPVLFFTEVDRSAVVWINGQRVLDEGPSRRPFVVEPAGSLRAGERNQITVRVDHHHISTRFLGGIVRPVLLIDRRE